MSRKKWVVTAVVLIVLFIFTQSAMPVSKSAGESTWILKNVVNPILRFFGIRQLNGDNLVRKVAHVTEFAFLAFFSFFLWKGKLLWTIPMCFTAAFLDESIQILSGRGSSIRDVWIDLIGVSIGTAVGWLVMRNKNRRT